MDIAISGQLLGSQLSLESTLNTISAHGIKQVELWPENFPAAQGSNESRLYQNKDVHRAKALLSNAHMDVVCVTLGGGLIESFKKGGRAEATISVMAAVDAAAELGCPRVNTYLGGLDHNVYADIVRPAAIYAADLNVDIVIENEAHDDSGLAEDVHRLVSLVDQPNFGSLFDPCNFYQAGSEPFPAAYDILRDVVLYVHLKGGCLERPSLHRPFHRGGSMREAPDQFIAYTAIEDSAFNICSIVKEFIESGYTGPITLEPHVSFDEADEFYKRDVDFLRGLLAQHK